MSESKIPWPIICAASLLSGVVVGFSMGGDSEQEPAVEPIQLEQSVVETSNTMIESPKLKLSAQASSEQSKVLIKQLKGQVDKLSKKLAAADKQLNKLRKQNENLSADNHILQNQLTEISDAIANRRNNQTRTQSPGTDLIVGHDINEDFGDEPYLPASDLSQLLSTEHSQFYTKRHRALVKKINEFNDQERDENWAFEMEMNISDFITNHFRSDGVSAQINCRADRCMAQVSERENGAWNEISQGLSKQDWWPFNSTTGGSTSTNKEGVNVNLTMYSITRR